MTEVMIDGVPYAPVSPQEPHTGVKRIGVGITTHNRPDALRETLRRWREVTPEWIPIVVVDDASTQPVPEADYRFDENVGIAVAKNKTLELLDDLGCDEFFLADDDTFPLVPEWWVPYVEHAEPHLMYIFKISSGPGIVYQDEKLIGWTDPRGCLLYLNKTVLEKVGGFDSIYGRWGYEHVDLSARIYYAGLTSVMFGDVPNGPTIWYCLDQDSKIKRSTPQAERDALVKKNGEIYWKRRSERYAGYIPYREQKNVVISCLYGAKPDPQRRGQYMSLEDTDAFLKSVKGAQVVLYTDSAETRSDAILVPSTLGMNVFFQRHLNAYQYLRENKDVRFAWCTDSTDVEMLSEPWSQMQEGILYVGYEPKTLDDAWMLKNHHNPEAVRFLDEHRGDQMMNAGVFGGSRDIMLKFLHRILEIHSDYEQHRLAQRITPLPADLGDMGVFQVAVNQMSVPVVWGSQVTTVFRAEERNSHSWWKHK